MLLPRFFSILLCFLAASLLIGCDSSKPSVNKNSRFPVGSEYLNLTLSQCSYPAHKYVRYSCYSVKRKGSQAHSYDITIIRPKQYDELRIQQALISVPGGPGQGAQTEPMWVQYWSDWAQSNQLRQDLILYNPPGTFGSSAYWRCKKLDKAILALIGQVISSMDESQHLRSIFDECLYEYDRWLTDTDYNDNGLASFNSPAVAQSLRYLMSALPYAKLHLLGTSYGTRVALLAAEDTNVATVIYDSPYPHAVGTLNDWPALLGKAFELHGRAFGEIAEHSFKNYNDVFTRAYNYLKQYPQQWTLERWDGREDIHFALTAERLLEIQFDVLYQADMRPLFYSGIQNIQAKPDDLRWVLESFVTTRLDPTFNPLLYLAVECNDNDSVSKDDFLVEASKSGDKLTDWAAFYEFFHCHHPLFKTNVTEVESIDTNVTEARPVKMHDRRLSREVLEKPALVVSGSYDPVTPSEWAEQLHAQLNNSELYIFPERGHAVLSADNCLAERLRLFWSESEHEKLPAQNYASFVERCGAEP